MGKGLFLCVWCANLRARTKRKKKKKKKQKKKTDDEDPLVLIFSPKVAMVAAWWREQLPMLSLHWRFSCENFLFFFFLLFSARYYFPSEIYFDLYCLSYTTHVHSSFPLSLIFTGCDKGVDWCGENEQNSSHPHSACFGCGYVVWDQERKRWRRKTHRGDMSALFVL